MSNGYAQGLIDIDDRMLALGRPPPPVMGAWLRSASKAMPSKERWGAACRQWREDLAAWEQANPQAAIDWLEMREEYRRLDEAIEATKWNTAKDAWTYEKLKRLGAPAELVDLARKPPEWPAFKHARDWMLSPEAWSLLLVGGVGVGKTGAAAWAAHQWILRDGRPKWVRCAALVDASMFGLEAEVHRQQCRTAGLLVLDDIGAGARSKDSKVFLGWLDDVLDSRWGNKRRTIITTNQAAAELPDWLGQRLADRLNEGMIQDCGKGSRRGKA